MSTLLGLIGIASGLGYVFTAKSSGFSGYFDRPSLVLLLVLPPSVMLLSHKVGDFFTGLRVLTLSMFQNIRREQSGVIDALTHCSAKVRADGLGSLIQIRSKIHQPLLRDGLSMIVNNFTEDEIRHNLEAKIQSQQARMALASNLFENMSKVSPGVGMIGTLVGLISMMSRLDDPSQIGGGMALALITTLYGLILGTLLYAPFGEKIAIEAEKMSQIESLILEGVLALKGKKSSLHMKNIMSTFGQNSSSAAPRGKPS